MHVLYGDSMDAVKYARWPAALVLLTSLLFAGAYAINTRKGASSAMGTGGTPLDMAGSEKSIAAGHADSRTWFAYAEQLRADGKSKLAADAYLRVLEKEPYQREARFWVAVCLADSAHAPQLEAYMEQLALSEAKLAVEVFQRRELAPYMSLPRMSALFDQAKDQARD
jgi:hypothetical protein